MEFNQGRKHLTIPKYSHPDSSKQKSDGNIYKTFSNNGMSNTQNISSYKKDTLILDDSHSCPICNQVCNFICQCIYSDKSCPNGHVWYINRKGEKELGTPHK